MMSREEIEAMLDRAEIPYRYFLFNEKEAVEPPFMVWYLPDSDNFSADGQVYYRINSLNLELYTNQKDFELEEQGIYWDKTEAYLDEEQMYEVLYEMEV